MCTNCVDTSKESSYYQHLYWQTEQVNALIIMTAQNSGDYAYNECDIAEVYSTGE